MNEAELDRLKQALKLLSEAEKQLRVSSERSTWFTATLLQLGSVASSDATQSGSSRRQSSKTTEGDPSSASREAHFPPLKSNSHISLPKFAIQNLPNQEDPFLLTNAINTNSKHTQSRFISGGPSDKLDDIWVRCIKRCHSKTLRQLLLTCGKLISISEVEG